MRTVDEVLPGLWRFPLAPFDALNAYLLGDVLVDSGGRHSVVRFLAMLDGHTIGAHALTHAHFDHQGASHAVCDRLGLPLWCGAGDRGAAESGDLRPIMPRPESWMAGLGQRFAGPGHPVSRELGEGDEVGGFTVVETPGHTPGHLAFWRERDRALVIGDVLFHRNPLTLRKRLAEPFAAATLDPSRNRASARKLAALEPSVICFGHGPPLRDGARFTEFVSALPTDP